MKSLIRGLFIICLSLWTKPTNAQCVAAFTYQMNQLDSSTFIFMDSIVGGRTFSYWDFGDGTSYIGAGPITHKYYQNGSFRVCHTVADSVTMCIDSTCSTITVIGSSSKCKTSFTFKADGFEVSFTNTSLGVDSSWWDFGDGFSSTQTNPLHIYKTQGIYEVWLITKHENQCVDSLIQSVYVEKSVCRPKFRFAIDTTEKFKIYILNGTNIDTGHTYLWRFGDGNTSSERNPAHSYAQPGKYSICLEVRNKQWGCFKTYCDSIGMDGEGKLLKAGFSLEVIDDFIDLGISNMAAGSIEVYPNPASDNLHLNLETYPINAEIEIFSLNGELLQHWLKNKSSEIELDISNYKPGMYIVHVRSNGQHGSAKFIKVDH